MFEKSVSEKWDDKTGWGEEERSAWIKNAIKDRKMEQEFWERAQERMVREKGPMGGFGDGDVEEEGEMDDGAKMGGRKSVFGRFFASTVV